MLDFRLNCFDKFNELELPDFGPEINFDFDSITYYKKRDNKLTDNWDDVTAHIKDEFNNR